MPNFSSGKELAHQPRTQGTFAMHWSIMSSSIEMANFRSGKWDMWQTNAVILSIPPILATKATAQFVSIAGGPRISIGPTKRAYRDIREGWHMARLELETIVSSLDVGIKHEAHWESQWPLDTASAKSANTSLKASQLALMETKYPAATLPGPSQHKGVKRKHSTSKLRRTVSFAPEITCRADPNVIDEPHAVRISQEPINFESVDRDFNRRSDDYKPGAHAAPSGQVWAETSFTTYGTEYQDLTNMKVFMTNSLSEFSKIGNDPTDYINLQHYILSCQVTDAKIEPVLRSPTSGKLKICQIFISINTIELTVSLAS
ncbi:hypothetical protein HBH92_050780 [Parastagonospora nodorum]|nr:hypothetical protein HBH92_050780 [Parastagonospora nodorum]KAH4449669.1 hypothetical protein HBH93_038350 [Parastagonospora nodorum]KAH4463682.1 hypothetical protein HBH91_046850 [Parastagonospora nodorum]KAH4506437.1 hypothetical protein HBH89_076880 [Parastagonospora nodorum]KAH4551778.1 hypothetical protein HBH85_033290 [Parastagonospora nodorum]